MPSFDPVHQSDLRGAHSIKCPNKLSAHLEFPAQRQVHSGMQVHTRVRACWGLGTSV
jgi:hypothetical protein